MRNLFREHIPLSDEQIASLWDTGVFVFDTNTLLNFYRYSSPTADALREAISYYSERAWLPNQVGKEYFKNRLIVISGQVNNYNEPKRNLQTIKALLSNRRGHPFISNDLLKKYELVISEIEQEFALQTSALDKLISKDEFFEFVTNMFNNKIGINYSHDELEKIYQEGRIRYANKVPPGFGDDKPEPDRYGDLIVWKQIIDFAKEKKVDVIFISDEERKGDWMHVHSGKTLGPLSSLKKEFYEETGRLFHMYPAFRFLELAFANKEKEISPVIIEEVKEVSENSILSSFKVVDVRCELMADSFESDHFKAFTAEINNAGYSVDFFKDSQAEIYILLVKLPFKDLERRFKKKLEDLLTLYRVVLKSYTSSSSLTTADDRLSIV